MKVLLNSFPLNGPTASGFYSQTQKLEPEWRCDLGVISLGTLVVRITIGSVTL